MRTTLDDHERKNLPEMRVIDDPGIFAIADRYWLRHGSAESPRDEAVIKFGILFVFHPNPGCHIRFSDEAGKCKKKGFNRTSKSQCPAIIPSRIKRRTVFQRGQDRDQRCRRSSQDVSSSGSAWRCRLEMERTWIVFHNAS